MLTKMCQITIRSESSQYDSGCDLVFQGPMFRDNYMPEDFQQLKGRLEPRP